MLIEEGWKDLSNNVEKAVRTLKQKDVTHVEAFSRALKQQK